MNEKKKGFNYHILLIAALAVIVIFCIVKIILWDRNTRVEQVDAEEGEFDMECLDFYVYPDEELLANRPDDGVNTIVVFGNNLVTNKGEKHSIINMMKEGLDAEIINLAVDNSKMCNYQESINYGIEAFSLNNLISSIENRDFSFQEGTTWGEAFVNEEDYEGFIETIKSVDFDKVDTVMFMYSLSDYYNGTVLFFQDDKNPRGYHGAILSPVAWFQENYPHINIIISSPVPEFTYIDGKMVLSTETDFGMGNSSEYTSNLYAVATEKCVSYIDNYYYKISESNINEYVDGYNLNDDGIDLIGEHVVNFIKH